MDTSPDASLAVDQANKHLAGSGISASIALGKARLASRASTLPHLSVGKAKNDDAPPKGSKPSRSHRRLAVLKFTPKRRAIWNISTSTSSAAPDLMTRRTVTKASARLDGGINKQLAKFPLKCSGRQSTCDPREIGSRSLCGPFIALWIFKMADQLTNRATSKSLDALRDHVRDLGPADATWPRSAGSP
jgi:hypothetical protein